MLYFRQGVVSITDACNYEALPVTSPGWQTLRSQICTEAEVNGNYMTERYAQEEKGLPILRGELVSKYHTHLRGCKNKGAFKRKHDRYR